MLADRVRMSYIKKGGIPDYYVMATDSDFSGTTDGNFKYIGSHEYVIIPHIIKGVNVTSYFQMFLDNTSTVLKGIASDNPNVTNMGSMFGNSSVTTLDLSSFDTSSVTNMGLMFIGCTGLTSLDVSTFDTSNVTTMNLMFGLCSSLTSLDLSSFDTSKVTITGQMFYNCISITTAYARTQADANKFNASSQKPSNVNFVVK